MTSMPETPAAKVAVVLTAVPPIELFTLPARLEKLMYGAAIVASVPAVAEITTPALAPIVVSSIDAGDWTSSDLARLSVNRPSSVSPPSAISVLKPDPVIWSAKATLAAPDRSSAARIVGSSHSSVPPVAWALPPPAWMVAPDSVPPPSSAMVPPLLHSRVLT